MKLGAHLPLADLAGPADRDSPGGHRGAALAGYAAAARDLGFTTLSANDHLLWGRPWLDGPTALASVLASSGDMTLATSVTLPVVRHPVVVAKMLTTLATLAPGRVVGGLGPGSSRLDYEAVGVPFDQRWARFDESLRLVRSLVRGESPGPSTFYPLRAQLSPLSDPPPQIWFGSWGSDRRLAAMAATHGRRLVRLGLQRHTRRVRPGAGPPR